MARVIKRISLTDEEIKILTKAKDILKDVYDELEKGELIDNYENSEYIIDILDISCQY